MLYTLSPLKITIQSHSYFLIRFRSEKHLPSGDIQLEVKSCSTLCNPMDYTLSPGFSRQESQSGLPFPSPIQLGVGANKGFSNSEQDSSLYHVSSQLQIKTQYGSIYIKFRWRKNRDVDIG